MYVVIEVDCTNPKCAWSDDYYGYTQSQVPSECPICNYPTSTIMDQE
jgi:hypothetical protein